MYPLNLVSGCAALTAEVNFHDWSWSSSWCCIKPLLVTSVLQDISVLEDKAEAWICQMRRFMLLSWHSGRKAVRWRPFMLSKILVLMLLALTRWLHLEGLSVEANSCRRGRLWNIQRGWPIDDLRCSLRATYLKIFTAGDIIHACTLVMHNNLLNLRCSCCTSLLLTIHDALSLQQFVEAHCFLDMIMLFRRASYVNQSYSSLVIIVSILTSFS